MPRLTHRYGTTRRARPAHHFFYGYNPTLWERRMEKELGIRRKDRVGEPITENLQFTPGKERK